MRAEMEHKKSTEKLERFSDRVKCIGIVRNISRFIVHVEACTKMFQCCSIAAQKEDGTDLRRTEVLVREQR